MKKLLAVVLALGMIVGLVAVADAGVKVGGNLQFEFAYGWYNDGWGGMDEQVDLDSMHSFQSHLYVNYMSDDKRFQAYGEVQVTDATRGNNVSTRQVYIRYNWDNGYLLMGQAYTITNQFRAPRYIATNLRALYFGYGAYYDDRVEQITVSVGKKFQWFFSITQQAKETNIFMSPVDGTTSIRSFNYINVPPLSAALIMNFGNVQIHPWVRWEMQHANLVGYDDQTFHSIDAGLQINGDFGLIGFTVGIHGGMNSANVAGPGPWPGAFGPGSFGSVLVWTNTTTGSLVYDRPGYPMYDPVADKYWDHYLLQGFGELRIAGLSLGGGVAHSMRPDVWDQAGFEYPTTYCVYARYAIPFGKMVWMPEVAYMDQGNNQLGVRQPQCLVFGFMAMIPF